MLATWAVKSKFVGEIAWFSDYWDAYQWVEAQGTTLDPDHYQIVELDYRDPYNALENHHSDYLADLILHIQGIIDERKKMANG